MPMFLPAQRTASTFVAAMMLFAAPAVLAAPATTEELSGETTGSPGATVMPGPSATGTPSMTGVPQSRTVELLLQLQDNPQALTAEAQGSNRDGSRRVPVAAALNGASAPANEAEEANLRERLKAAMLESAAPRPAATEARNDRSSDPETSTASLVPRSSYGAGGRSSEPRESLLSNPVIRFIRENRVLVVMTSLAILAAIWGTANFSMRRSR